MQMQRLYAQWCKENNQTPKDHYAFKCTDGGAAT
jgi:type I restriction enzyme R subunit